MPEASGQAMMRGGKQPVHPARRGSGAGGDKAGDRVSAAEETTSPLLAPSALGTQLEALQEQEEGRAGNGDEEGGEEGDEEGGDTFARRDSLQSSSSKSDFYSGRGRNSSLARPPKVRPTFKALEFRLTLWDAGLGGPGA